MIALLHFSPDGKHTLGAWVRDGSAPAISAYRGSPLEYQIGKEAIENQPPHEDWLDWCRQLSARTPVDAWYEIRDVPDGSTAQDALDAEVAKQFRRPSSE